MPAKTQVSSANSLPCGGTPYEDVARAIKDSWPDEAVGEVILFSLAHRLADLFTTNNPRRCTHCGKAQPNNTVCPDGSGLLPHHFVGFDRNKFLVACGLEKEG